MKVFKDLLNTLLCKYLLSHLKYEKYKEKKGKNIRSTGKVKMLAFLKFWGFLPLLKGLLLVNLRELLIVVIQNGNDE